VSKAASSVTSGAKKVAKAVKSAVQRFIEALKHLFGGGGKHGKGGKGGRGGPMGAEYGWYLGPLVAIVLGASAAGAYMYRRIGH